MPCPAKVFLFTAVCVAFALAAQPYSQAETNTVMSGAPATEKRWDQWTCKNLKTDWNYLFHPDRVNQYHLPNDTIDNDRGEDQSWLNAIRRQQAQ